MMTEQIKVLWMPKAKAMGPLFAPMLQRSYEMFQTNNRKAVVSGYAGGNCLVVTTITPEGQVAQLAFCREEIPDLPEVARELLEKDLKRPGQKGWFTGNLDT